MQLTKDFSTDELRCPCCNVCAMNPGFMAALQVLRNKWGKPIRINSGFRCEKHNTKVGGATDSQHLKGNAADCETSATDRFDFVKLAFEVGFKGVGVAKTYVHLDIRDGAPAFWTYPL